MVLVTQVSKDREKAAGYTQYIANKIIRLLGEPFVMALGETGCIVAYPQETWLKVLSEIASNPSTNQGRQQFARMTTGTAEDELKFDKQGRNRVQSGQRRPVGHDRARPGPDQVDLVGPQMFRETCIPIQ